MIRHIIAVGFVFACTSAAWFVLAAVVDLRTDQMGRSGREQVGQLWGSAMRQVAPAIHDESDQVLTALSSSQIDVDLDLDHRKKGLLWFSTYAVDFRGQYAVEHHGDAPQKAMLVFTLPDPNAVYDGFELQVDGATVESLDIVQGKIRHPITLNPGQPLAFKIAYATQGTDRWDYHFGNDVKQVRDFRLTMHTNFDAIDYPEDAISPTQAKREEGGWQLDWTYSNLLSGVQIGMAMPAKLNPGPWVQRLTYAAPVSLFLFFFLMLIITTLRGIHVHPMNYFFLATAFFSYHLLLGYLVDHISIHLAFWICSAVSIFLATSYMRLVAGARFALLETGLSQFVFLVLFSYTFFFEGYTGLTITILCILTLFIVMQATGRMDWQTIFETPHVKKKVPDTPAAQAT